MDLSSIQNKLNSIQNELHAPKANRNDFANFNYRSAEDIEAAVKPLLHKEGLLLTLSDELVFIGERYYIKATATVRIGEEYISSVGYAREQLTKKGMDESQVTGSTSSYARKYALTGLFLIDNEKDADSMDNSSDNQSQSSQQPVDEKPWYNNFDKHKQTMIDRINNGEAAEQIVDTLRLKFKVSTKTAAQILDLKG
jgi:hypothetical protein